VSSELFDPLLSAPVVKVDSTSDRTQFRISWPDIAGATGFRVYAGFDPLYIRSLISGISPLPEADREFLFTAGFVPPGQIIYFWVAAESPSGLTFLDDLGGYTLRTQQASRFSASPGPFSEDSLAMICPEDNLYFIEEMRRRAKAILEDTGEEVDVFIKQWRGLPDPNSQREMELDPNFQTMTRSDRTYGVGFYPGYFPAIRMRMRFGQLPVSQLEMQQPGGLRPLLSNESWSLWDPILHENDLIVRSTTGQRYVVNSVSFSNYRGVPITQRQTLEIVTPTSQLQKITDADVRSKWRTVNSANFLRLGFGVVAEAEEGGPDFLIFR
jgi:hypothetical protein